MVEHPLGHTPALRPGCFVCEAEVNAQQDAGVDHFLGRVREAVIRSCRLHYIRGEARDLKVILSRLKKSSSVLVMAPVTLFAPEV